MQANIKDYIFVSLQLLLFIAFVFKVDGALELLHGMKTFGIFLLLFGGILLLISLLQLNKNLSPFPTPKADAALIQTGLYKYIRHPIYTSILILFIGYSLYQNSIYKLAITLLLGGLFYFKSKYEENQLAIKFTEYPAYKNKTGRFLPKFFSK